jgi:hypothetical protein
MGIQFDHERPCDLISPGIMTTARVDPVDSHLRGVVYRCAEKTDAASL